MKVRIGITLGQSLGSDNRPEEILDFVDHLEALDVDSLWVSDRLVSPGSTLEPITFLSYIAGRLRRMKFGTSTLVLPTRNPVILAKELATLDFISQGRLFPAVGLGSDDAQDFAAVGVSKKERGQRTDEAIVLMRRLWSEDNVSFSGNFFSIQDVTITPRPWQKGGPPIWIGGRSQAALRRTARLGDGWLVSGASAAEVGDGIKAIRAYAAEAGRVVPEDHYGVLLPFYFARSAEEAYEAAKNSLRPRPDLSPFDFTALGTPEEVRQKIGDYIDAGATKFVMRPCGPFAKWHEQIDMLASEVIQRLQTPDRES
jgi:probable F420-dependent oxidoreductase